MASTDSCARRASRSRRGEAEKSFTATGCVRHTPRKSEQVKRGGGVVVEEEEGVIVEVLIEEEEEEKEEEEEEEEEEVENGLVIGES